MARPRLPQLLYALDRPHVLATLRPQDGLQGVAAAVGDKEFERFEAVSRGKYRRMAQAVETSGLQPVVTGRLVSAAHAMELHQRLQAQDLAESAGPRVMTDEVAAFALLENCPSPLHSATRWMALGWLQRLVLEDTPEYAAALAAAKTHAASIHQDPTRSPYTDGPHWEEARLQFSKACATTCDQRVIPGVAGREAAEAWAERVASIGGYAEKAAADARQALAGFLGFWQAKVPLVSDAAAAAALYLEAAAAGEASVADSDAVHGARLAGMAFSDPFATYAVPHLCVGAVQTLPRETLSAVLATATAPPPAGFTGLLPSRPRKRDRWSTFLQAMEYARAAAAVPASRAELAAAPPAPLPARCPAIAGETAEAWKTQFSDLPDMLLDRLIERAAGGAPEAPRAADWRELGVERFFAGSPFAPAAAADPEAYHRVWRAAPAELAAPPQGGGAAGLPSFADWVAEFRVPAPSWDAPEGFAEYVRAAVKPAGGTASPVQMDLEAALRTVRACRDGWLALSPAERVASMRSFYAAPPPPLLPFACLEAIHAVVQEPDAMFTTTHDMFGAPGLPHYGGEYAEWAVLTDGEKFAFDVRAPFPEFSERLRKLKRARAYRWYVARFTAGRRTLNAATTLHKSYLTWAAANRPPAISPDSPPCNVFAHVNFPLDTPGVPLYTTVRAVEQEWSRLLSIGCDDPAYRAFLAERNLACSVQAHEQYRGLPFEAAWVLREGVARGRPGAADRLRGILRKFPLSVYRSTLETELARRQTAADGGNEALGDLVTRCAIAAAAAGPAPSADARAPLAIATVQQTLLRDAEDGVLSLEDTCDGDVESFYVQLLHPRLSAVELYAAAERVPFHIADACWAAESDEVKEQYRSAAHDGDDAADPAAAAPPDDWVLLSDAEVGRWVERELGNGVWEAVRQDGLWSVMRHALHEPTGKAMTAFAGAPFNVQSAVLRDLNDNWPRVESFFCSFARLQPTGPPSLAASRLVEAKTSFLNFLTLEDPTAATDEQTPGYHVFSSQLLHGLPADDLLATAAAQLWRRLPRAARVRFERAALSSQKAVSPALLSKLGKEEQRVVCQYAALSGLRKELTARELLHGAPAGGPDGVVEPVTMYLKERASDYFHSAPETLERYILLSDAERAEYAERAARATEERRQGGSDAVGDAAECFPITHFSREVTESATRTGKPAPDRSEVLEAYYQMPAHARWPYYLQARNAYNSMRSPTIDAEKYFVAHSLCSAEDWKNVSAVRQERYASEIGLITQKFAAPAYGPTTALEVLLDSAQATFMSYEEVESVFFEAVVQSPELLAALEDAAAANKAWKERDRSVFVRTPRSSVLCSALDQLVRSEPHETAIARALGVEADRDVITLSGATTLATIAIRLECVKRWLTHGDLPAGLLYPEECFTLDRPGMPEEGLLEERESMKLEFYKESLKRLEAEVYHGSLAKQLLPPYADPLELLHGDTGCDADFLHSVLQDSPDFITFAQDSVDARDSFSLASGSRHKVHLELMQRMEAALASSLPTVTQIKILFSLLERVDAREVYNAIALQIIHLGEHATDEGGWKHLVGERSREPLHSEKLMVQRERAASEGLREDPAWDLWRPVTFLAHPLPFDARKIPRKLNVIYLLVSLAHGIPTPTLDSEVMEWNRVVSEIILAMSEEERTKYNTAANKAHRAFTQQSAGNLLVSQSRMIRRNLFRKPIPRARYAVSDSICQELADKILQNRGDPLQVLEVLADYAPHFRRQSIVDDTEEDTEAE